MLPATRRNASQIHAQGKWVRVRRGNFGCTSMEPVTKLGQGHSVGKMKSWL